MKTTTFNKTRIATCLSLAMGAMLSHQAMAQEAQADDQEIEAGNFEVIEVSGIRESLTKSMLTKKAASGVRNKKARNWAGGDSEKKLEKGWMRKVQL